MTNQMKFLLAGLFFMILVTALALIMSEKKDFLSSPESSMSSGEAGEQSDRMQTDPVKTQPQVRLGAAPQESQAGKTAVSQAQLDLMTRREEARIRRDEMLEVRAQTIEELGPGNTGEPQ